MKNNVLLLHIGKEKTGTTALQNFMTINAHTLYEEGWCYPTEPILIKNGSWDNGSCFYEEDNQIDSTSENWRRVWSCVLRHLESSNVIISAEKLSIHHTQTFLKEAKKMYDNIKVIIYLRRQDRYIESLWNHYIKTEMISEEKSLWEFWENYLYKHKLAYYDEMESIAQIVGKENLIVRVYEKQQFEGERQDVLSDFFKAISMNLKWKDYNISVKNNQRIYGNDLMIKQIMNQVLNRESGMIYKREVSGVFRKQGAPVKNAIEEGFFSPQERQRILEEFHAQNELVAREYLHKEDGRLFYDMNVDIPHYVSPITPIEEDLIRTFTTLLCEQNRRLDVMQILLKKGQRKLAYFGAGEKGQKLLEENRLPVEIFIDNDPGKIEMMLKGIKIIEARSIEDWSNYFVVITCIRTCEIEKQLQQYGLVKDVDYILAKDYFAL